MKLYLVGLRFGGRSSEYNVESDLFTQALAILLNVHTLRRCPTILLEVECAPL